MRLIVGGLDTMLVYCWFVILGVLYGCVSVCGLRVLLVSFSLLPYCCCLMMLVCCCFGFICLCSGFLFIWFECIGCDCNDCVRFDVVGFYLIGEFIMY